MSQIRCALESMDGPKTALLIYSIPKSATLHFTFRVSLLAKEPAADQDDHASVLTSVPALPSQGSSPVLGVTFESFSLHAHGETDPWP